MMRKMRLPMPSVRLPVLVLISLLCLLPAQAQSDRDAIPQPEPRPMPSAVLVEGDVWLEWHFSSIMQGGVGLLRLQAESIHQARLLFLGGEFPFFQLEGDGWYALAAVSMNVRPGDYELTVLAQGSAGAVRFRREVRIEAAHYITQDFNIPGARAYLADPELEAAEFAKLDAITAAVTSVPLWDAVGFALPLASQTTSPFGAYRLLNQGVRTRHTGWDQRAAAGTPVKSAAAGVVAFAGRLDIRGNYVMIDHGYGIYSGYAHFSELQVTRGQRIAAGQIIGMSGNSGRSSGPHLHWEMAVHGEWVDGLAFIKLWLPTRCAARCADFG